jgi:O-glycosyl hydrolase
MNWSYYAPLYSNAEFTKMWNLIAYLNGKGITTNGVIFNFMGPGPGWMGGGSLTAGQESEWAEMIASLLVWARYTNGLQFTYVGPDNEPDIANEGITISSASQYVTALRALAQQLDANGLSDVRLIGPDRAGGGTAYMPEMMADAVVMGKLAHFGVHSYSSGGGGSSGVYAYLQGSAYPDRTFWMTEFNVWCSTCDSGTRGTYDWAYCEGTANYLLSHLANGASGGTVWEGYDSFYLHPPTAWSFWGLFSVDNENAAVKTYTPRKNFYTVAQISKFVRPGAQRIRVSGSTSSLSPLLAFKHTGLGQVTIVGINTSGSAVNLSGSLASLPMVPHLDLYYTSASANLSNGGSMAVNNGTFSATIPADCVFTLTGFAGVNAALTSPVNGAQFNEPATIPLAATATTTVGSIALVGFYNGLTELGESTNAPYGFTWTNVPMGDYTLTARATDTVTNTGTSAPVSVTVVGPVAQVQVTPATVSVAQGNSQQFVATARDNLGHTLVPQPAFSWSVSGGGTIDSTGFFRAGGGVGGPFAVQASIGAVSGLAVVSVVAYNGGTLGNTNEGTSTDTIWNSGAWINASGFQAASNLMVASVHAKVAAIAGRYQCAIYSDSDGSPSAFMRGTAEVTKPSDGWNVFTLTSPLALASGQYYWLAIWSDDANAQVYYSGNSGALRWGRYDYGSWPDPIATTGSGSYNYCIFATEAAATGAPPNIAMQPTNLTVAVGGEAAMAVVADGTAPLSYQWSLGGTNLVAATNSVLVITNVQLSDAGSYAVEVSNAFGSEQSSNAVLGVGVPPTIVVQPKDQTVRLGGAATFEMVATGTAPLVYQWSLGGTNLVAATNSVVAIPSAQWSDGGSYAVVVSNAFGMASSTNAVLTVGVPPVIALQPESQVVNLGSNATFAVSAASDLPLSYQWYYNSTNALAEGTNNFLLLAGVGDADAGWYSVSVSNPVGAVVSSNAQLVINHLPVPASPTLPRYWGSGFKAPESIFLGTDPDEDSLFISSVSPLSVGGAAVSAGNGWVIYAPGAGLTNDDTFDYTVADGRGGFSLGTASVVVLTNRGPTLTVGWESGGAGTLHIVGNGIPYRSYALEFEEGMGAGWQPIESVMSDALGVFTYVESLIPGVSNRFYRVTTY